jgi:hypothetical protein
MAEKDLNELFYCERMCFAFPATVPGRGNRQ